MRIKINAGGAQMIQVTPDIARRWLGQPLPDGLGQRTLTRSDVEMYRRIIRAGNWQPQAGLIIIAENGACFDGQHRLTAILEEDVTVWACCTLNAPNETMKAAGQGRARSPADAYQMFGGHQAKRKVAIINLLFSLARRAKHGNRKLHYSEIEPALTQLQEQLDWVMSLYKEKLDLSGPRIVSQPGPIRAAFLYAKISGMSDDVIVEMANEIQSTTDTRLGRLIRIAIKEEKFSQFPDRVRLACIILSAIQAKRDKQQSSIRNLKKFEDINVAMEILTKIHPPRALLASLGITK